VVTRSNRLHVSRNLGDDTGGFDTGNKWQWGFILIFALDHEHVGKVDAAETQTHARVPRNKGFAWKALEAERFGRPWRFADYCAVVAVRVHHIRRSRPAQ
jgi:hypothetical protein